MISDRLSTPISPLPLDSKFPPSDPEKSPPPPAESHSFCSCGPDLVSLPIRCATIGSSTLIWPPPFVQPPGHAMTSTYAYSEPPALPAGFLAAPTARAPGIRDGRVGFSFRTRFWILRTP